MQSSLFDEQEPISEETLDDIYKDLLSKAKSVPAFSGEFLFSVAARKPPKLSSSVNHRDLPMPTRKNHLWVRSVS
jgi:hypothetical protein